MLLMVRLVLMLLGNREVCGGGCWRVSGSGSPLHSTPSYHWGTPDERHEGGGRLVWSWKDVPATGTMMTLSACGLAADYGQISWWTPFLWHSVGTTLALSQIKWPVLVLVKYPDRSPSFSVNPIKLSKEVIMANKETQFITKSPFPLNENRIE